jgi:hypothetical protein
MIVTGILPNSAGAGLGELRPPVSEGLYGRILATMQAASNSEIIMVIADNETATKFPLYFLQHGVENSGVNPNLLNRLEPGETVVIDVHAKNRNTITMPGNSALEQIFAGKQV